MAQVSEHITSTTTPSNDQYHFQCNHISYCLLLLPQTFVNKFEVCVLLFQQSVLLYAKVRKPRYVKSLLGTTLVYLTFVPFPFRQTTKANIQKGVNVEISGENMITDVNLILK